MDDDELRALSLRLCRVPGVVGVMLGGSRARGEHTAESDIDLGLYYRPPLDVVALGDLAAKSPVRSLWEASFTLDIARKAVTRGDMTYAAGCLFRAVEVCAHALHGCPGVWLINEKGAIASAGRLPTAPDRFAERAQRLLGSLGTTPEQLEGAIEAAADLVRDTTARCDANHPSDN